MKVHLIVSYIQARAEYVPNEHSRGVIGTHDFDNICFHLIGLFYFGNRLLDALACQS